MNTHQYINQVVANVQAHKWLFAGTFFIIFTLSYAVLFALDWLPEPVSSEVEAAEVVMDEEDTLHEDSVDTYAETSQFVDVDESTTQTANLATLPLTITIDSLDKTITVKNPTSRSITDLDNALLGGVVRHPDSATLSDDGNIFILGHSSYLPNVLNRNFQAFNGIQNLAWGDTIRLNSDDAEYVYRVDKVYQAKASALTVPVAGTGKMLTLATCNSFGSTDDRYIVEAKLIATNVL